MKNIYLDYAASTPVRPEVLTKMQGVLKMTGNASSINTQGRAMRGEIDEAREIVANYLGCVPENIIFNSGATEGNNQVLLQTPAILKNSGRGDHILMSAVEHHSVLKCADVLRERGFKVSLIPVDKYGVIKIDEFKKMLTDDVSLVSVMAVNNEMGAIQPLEEVADVLRDVAGDKKALLHVDAVQAVKTMNMEPIVESADFVTITGHKIYGPQGVGVLYVKNANMVTSLLVGGKQEYRKRAGTENVAGVAGMGEAVRILGTNFTKEYTEMVRLGKVLQDGLKEINNVTILGDQKRRAPGILNCYLPNKDRDALLARLDLAGLSVSAGSACTAGEFEASTVLSAMGLNVTRENAHIRLSWGRETTLTEIAKALEVFQNNI